MTCGSQQVRSSVLELTRIQRKATASTIKTASLAGTECVSSAIQADRLILADIALLVGKSNSRHTAELLDGVQAETAFREIDVQSGDFLIHTM